MLVEFPQSWRREGREEGFGPRGLPSRRARLAVVQEAAHRCLEHVHGEVGESRDGPCSAPPALQARCDRLLVREVSAWEPEVFCPMRKSPCAAHWSAGAARTQHGRTQGTETADTIFSTFWTLGVPHQGVGRLVSPETPLCGMWTVPFSLCLFSWSFSGRVCIRIPSSYKDASKSGLGPRLWLHFTLITSLKTSLQTQPHSEALEVRTSVCEF